MNGPWFPNAQADVVVANPLGGDPWQVTEQVNEDPFNSPHYVEPVTRYFHYWKASFVQRMCISQPRPLVAGESNRFVTALVPAGRVGSAASAVRRLDAGSGDALACSIAGGLFVANNDAGSVAGPWGETDAAVLWASGDGNSGELFVHRAKHVSLPGIEVVSEAMNVDADLQWREGTLTGTVASEREAEVRVTFDAAGARQEHVVTTNGVTSISLTA